MELVKRIAVPVAVRMSIPSEDLMQVGALGLIKAIDFYEPAQNARFETYANYYIKGEIRHYVRDKSALIRTPRKVQELLFKISKAKKAMTNKGIDDVTEDMIAEALDMPVNQVLKLLRYEQYKNTVSLDYAVLANDDEETPLLDKIPNMDAGTFGDCFEEKLVLSSAVDRLKPDLCEVIKLSFYQDLSQREIANRLNISQMQVSRKVRKALNSLYEIIQKN